MGKYIVKRVLYIILVFFILSFMIYMIYNMLPIDKAAATAAKTEVQANQGKLDYERAPGSFGRKTLRNGRYNMLERYFRWLGIYPLLVTADTTACFRAT